MNHHDVLIVGAGNSGISLAAKLLRDGSEDVAVIESQDVHRYRPLLNYVGSGEATMAALERPAASVVPDGCTAIRDEVVAVEADGPSVLTRSGRRITCSTLVVCPGLEEDWDATPGLREAYAAGWAGSTFDIGTVRGVWPALRDLRDGRVVFTVPPEPAPWRRTASGCCARPGSPASGDVTCRSQRRGRSTPWRTWRFPTWCPLPGAAVGGRQRSRREDPGGARRHRPADPAPP